MSLCFFHLLSFEKFLSFIFLSHLSCKSQGDFCPSFFEVDFQGHKGIAPLRAAGYYIVDLAFVQKQFACAVGLGHINGCLFVRCDMHTDEEDFVADRPCIGFLKAAAVLPEAFYLSSCKHYAGFKLLLYVIFMISFSIGGYCCQVLMPQ